MAKRKRTEIESAVSVGTAVVAAPPPTTTVTQSRAQSKPAQPSRRSVSTSKQRTKATPTPAPPIIDPNPDTNATIKDGPAALRASPDAEHIVKAEEEDDDGKKPGRQIAKGAAAKKPAKAKAKTKMTTKTKVEQQPSSDSSLSELSDIEEPVKPIKPKARGKPPVATPKEEVRAAAADPEVEGDEEADPEELNEALSRPPPVNSSYLPLPWKGRLGYACLNTYLRTANPPVFSSRTCRIASILEHRHPLQDPKQPEHATKNRPDKSQPADVARGQAYVEALGLANAQDIPKMLRWNDRYNIKFLRLSSEMFPFASHDVYGYRLASFASDALAEAGRVAAELGHRLTTHPGQFTQLGSPRDEVIKASFRDLEYHCELLELLKMPPQQDRDAVMILHMGGVFGDKAATIARFKENYARLSQKIKNRLVLENDDVCYSVHDLLPVCEELNIPMVLDFHHHNILFDPDEIREGTLDIMGLYDRILATWRRKQISPKMHYSEPTPQAVTARQRRKHNPRPFTLPPCPADMDLMIEAKDKEQAVFELMRTFKLPGFDTFNDVLPYTRVDENRAWKAPKKKKAGKKPKSTVEDEEGEMEVEPEPQPPPLVPADEVGMGGPEGRVYWPPGMEEWLRPKKREVKPRDTEKAKSTAEKAAQRRAEKAAWQAAREASAEGTSRGGDTATSASEAGELPSLDLAATKSVYDQAKRRTAKPVRAPNSQATAKKVKSVPTPSTTPSVRDDDDDDDDVDMPDVSDDDDEGAGAKTVGRNAPTLARRQSGRGPRRAINYADVEDE